MRAVRSANTRPEIALRQALWARGLRYRLKSSLVGKPDLVFPRKRVAVFVDGDFWHGRQWRTRGFASLEAQMGRVNGSDYWIQKLNRTLERDAAVNEALASNGWRVVRLWETDVLKNPGEAAERVEAQLEPIG